MRQLSKKFAILSVFRFDPRRDELLWLNVSAEGFLFREISSVSRALLAFRRVLAHAQFSSQQFIFCFFLNKQKEKRTNKLIFTFSLFSRN